MFEVRLFRNDWGTLPLATYSISRLPDFRIFTVTPSDRILRYDAKLQPNEAILLEFDFKDDNGGQNLVLNFSPNQQLFDLSFSLNLENYSGEFQTQARISDSEK